MTSTALIHLLLTYRYDILFPLVAVEGPLATMAVGFLVSLHLMNPIIALPIIVAGDVASDVFYYFVGRFGSEWAWGRWIINRFRLSSHESRIIESFSRHGGRDLLIGKLTHALGAFFLIGAGFAKMRLGKFIWYNTLGTIIKSSALLYLGYLAGAAYARFNTYLEYGSMAVTLFVILLVLGFLYFSVKIFNPYKKRHKKKIQR